MEKESQKDEETKLSVATNPEVETTSPSQQASPSSSSADMHHPDLVTTDDDDDDDDSEEKDAKAVNERIRNSDDDDDDDDELQQVSSSPNIQKGSSSSRRKKKGFRLEVSPEVFRGWRKESSSTLVDLEVVPDDDDEKSSSCVLQNVIPEDSLEIRLSNFSGVVRLRVRRRDGGGNTIVTPSFHNNNSTITLDSTIADSTNGTNHHKHENKKKEEEEEEDHHDERRPTTVHDEIAFRALRSPAIPKAAAAAAQSRGAISSSSASCLSEKNENVPSDLNNRRGDDSLTFVPSSTESFELLASAAVAAGNTVSKADGDDIQQEVEKQDSLSDSFVAGFLQMVSNTEQNPVNQNNTDGITTMRSSRLTPPGPLENDDEQTTVNPILHAQDAGDDQPSIPKNLSMDNSSVDDDDDDDTTSLIGQQQTTTTTTTTHHRGSRLHELCANPAITFEELQDALKEDPSAAKRVDGMGQMPLHILGCNIYADPAVVKRFTLTLLALNPAALWTAPEVPELDESSLVPGLPQPTHYVPFVQPIYDWISSIYDKKRKRRHRKINGPTQSEYRTGFHPFVDLMDNISEFQRRRLNFFRQQSSVCDQDGGFTAGVATTTEPTGTTTARAGGSRDMGDSYYNSSGDGVAFMVSPTASIHGTTSLSTSPPRDGDGVVRGAPIFSQGSIPYDSYISLEPNELKKQYRRMPRRVEVTDAAHFAFEMLSACMDFICSSENVSAQMYTEPSQDLTENFTSRSEFGRNSSISNNDYRIQLIQREHFAEQVAIVPQLIKTILLIEDDDTRLRLLNSSIMKRVLLCHDSIGSWLLHMLKRGGLPSRRAVDYFNTLSRVSVQDFCCSGMMRTPLDSDVKAFEAARKECLQKLESYGEVIPSLFVLPEREVERAAATRIVWEILNDALARPFVIGIVLIDLILHLTMMIAYRSSIANRTLNPLKQSLGENAPELVVNALTSFFLLRKISESLALLQISRSVLKSYLFNIWNIIDTLTIILIMSANDMPASEQDENPVLNGITICLLWLKVLGFLKAVNMQMATFILALIKIIKDIRFFAVVLVVVVVMFGDMMHFIFTTTEDGIICLEEDDNDGVQDFCNPDTGRSYLRMYAILVGDFEFADYQQTSLIETVFIIFTIVGVIMLLNVLIAVVSNSYERATEQSTYLFGRARVVFVAEHMALERFLQPGKNPLQLYYDQLEGQTDDDDMEVHYTFCRRTLMVLVQCGRWAVLLFLIACTIIANVYLLGTTLDSFIGDHGTVFMIILQLIMLTTLTVAVLILFDFILRSPLEERLKRTRKSGLPRWLTWYGNGVQRVIFYIRLRVFGDMKLQLPHEAEAEAENAQQQLEQQQWMIDRLIEMENRLNTSMAVSEARLLDAVAQDDRRRRREAEGLREGEEEGTR